MSITAARQARALEEELFWNDCSVQESLLSVRYRPGLTVSRAPWSARHPLGLSVRNKGSLKFRNDEGVTAVEKMSEYKITPTVNDFLHRVNGGWTAIRLSEVPGMIRCEIVGTDGAFLP